MLFPEYEQLKNIGILKTTSRQYNNLKKSDDLQQIISFCDFLWFLVLTN